MWAKPVPDLARRPCGRRSSRMERKERRARDRCTGQAGAGNPKESGTPACARRPRAGRTSCRWAAGPLGRWAAGPLGRWAAGPLGRWAAGPLGRWAAGPLGRWAAGPLGRWAAGPLGRWAAGPLGRWAAGPLGRWAAGPLGRWAAGPLGRWAAGPLGRWAAGPLGRWAAGPLGRWAAGPLGRWAAGPLGRWAAGPLGRWAAGQLYAPEAGADVKPSFEEPGTFSRSPRPRPGAPGSRIRAERSTDPPMEPPETACTIIRIAPPSSTPIRTPGTHPPGASRRPVHLTGTILAQMIDRLQPCTEASGDMPPLVPDRHPITYLDYSFSAR